MKSLIKPPAASLSDPLTTEVSGTTTDPTARQNTSPLDRRDLLRTMPNPDPISDYVVRFEIESTPSFALGPLKFVARYVPDKVLLDPSCLNEYLLALTQPEWPALEALALAMRDDFGNELIPRWIEIVVSPLDASIDNLRHSVLVKDRQPQWDNARLLARLRDS